MLDNINSAYILRKTLSYMDEGKKLELVIYNKNLQNKLNISITNYKFFRGRYKIGGKVGTVKEFNGLNDELIFEGNYFNGKRNGKGKEYDGNGRLKFEGKNLKGKRNGKGKEYDDFQKLIFEGEYLNGKRNGKGKEYDENGRLKFEGEYLNGKRNGKGKEYDKHGLIFEGEYLNGKRNGK